MTTSRTQFLSEILSGHRIPEHKLSYFRARLQTRIYNLIINAFSKNGDKLKQADIAERIGMDPGQLNRLLTNPGNWQISTVSDLLLGISAAEMTVEIEPLVHSEGAIAATRTATPKFVVSRKDGAILDPKWRVKTETSNENALQMDPDEWRAAA